ncbi:MAG TPA: thiamine pyrophosphate-requiring protein [Rhizobiaceae bacterium]|nr:thiamine pyrophosphate-requiring protein [Rhizobiaceae bacterium]
MNHIRTENTFAAEALLGRMKAAGIDVLLANAGTDFPSIIEAYARSAETGIAMPEPLIVPHEGVAVGMAHGYYLITGKPAAVMVHVNVGLANSVMGLINAASEAVPIVMCSGRTPLTETGRFGSRSSPIHWGQEMRDQAAMIREVVKWDYELRYPEQAGPAIDRAVNIAMSEPRGPVYLSLPREALADAAASAGDSRPAYAPTSYGPPRPEMVALAAEALARAKRPVIIAQSPEIGEGFEPLAGFAERFALPVVEYWATRQALPGSHPMNVGREPTPWVRDADVIVVANAAVPWVAGNVELDPNCTVIALGPDPLYQKLPMRSFRIDISLAGGLNAGLRALDETMRAMVPADERFTARREHVASQRATTTEALEKRVAMGSGSPMSPTFVSRRLSDAAPDAAFFNELGVDPTAMRFEKPGSYFFTPISGGLGWGVPAALGAQLANRNRQMIATVGDGSYMFANPVACHQTAAALKLPLLTVVFNNGIWNAVRRSTLQMYPDGRAAAANVMPMTALDPSPDYAAVARAHGAHAERVESGDALPEAIKRALAATASGQQAMLEVMVSY